MLQETAFLVWCRRLELSERTRAVIGAIRTAPPSRLVRSGAGNVPCRYPSLKMGHTIQAESHTVELPFVHQLEQDPDVLEYWDQPAPIRLEYRSTRDRRVVTSHTADYFVLRTAGAGWVECKPELRLRHLAEHAPHRYHLDETGQWRCPPGEAHAACLGLSYHLWSAAAVNWTAQRNWAYLADYCRADCPAVRPEVAALVEALVEAEPGISLTRLLKRAGPSATADDLNRLVATARLYVDLGAAVLAEPDYVRVFRDGETARAYAIITQTAPAPGPVEAPPLVQVREGAPVHWDGRPWTVGPVNETHTVLVSTQGTPVELHRAVFDTYVRVGRIVGVAAPPAAGLNDEGRAQMAQAGWADQAEANRRHAIIRPHLEAGVPLATCGAGVPRSTKCAWVRQWHLAEAAYGHGYPGLLPHAGNRARRPRVLTGDLAALLDATLAEHYATVRHGPKRRAYDAFVLACAAAGYPAVSARTFYSAAARFQTRAAVTLAREGPRAAYPHQPPVQRTAGQPRHGDRPWELAHLDHTELDLELVSSRTGQPLGRPWATLLIDAASRRILAVFLSFARPSVVAGLMALRICVQRWGRLPHALVVDGGPEFHSIAFETLLGWYQVTHKTRPPAEPRYGALVERLFSTANTTFTHTLLGNTQVMRQVRLVSRSVNPQTHARWTLADLYRWFRTWAHEVYDTTAHAALGQSPRDAYHWSQSRSGARAHLAIPYDQDFIIRTLPSTRKGTARVRPGAGVLIHSVPYWSAAFHDPAVEGTAVAVRYDPFDVGHAYAYLAAGRQWVECHADYHALLQGRSVHELRLIAEELRAAHRVHGAAYRVTAKQLATFQAQVAVHEAVLLQRRRDLEDHGVLRLLMCGPDAGLDEPDAPPRAGGASGLTLLPHAVPTAPDSPGLPAPKVLPRLR